MSDQTNRESCYICGEPVGHLLETHHIVPRRHGGSDNVENLVDLCPSCHQALEKIYDKRFYNRLKNALDEKELAEPNTEDSKSKLRKKSSLELVEDVEMSEEYRPMGSDSWYGASRKFVVDELQREVSDIESDEEAKEELKRLLDKGELYIKENKAGVEVLHTT